MNEYMKMAEDKVTVWGKRLQRSNYMRNCYI